MGNTALERQAFTPKFRFSYCKRKPHVVDIFSKYTCRGTQKNLPDTLGGLWSIQIISVGYALKMSQCRSKVNFRCREVANGKVTLPTSNQREQARLSALYRDVCTTSQSRMTRTKVFARETSSTWVVSVGDERAPEGGRRRC